MFAKRKVEVNFSSKIKQIRNAEIRYIDLLICKQICLDITSAEYAANCYFFVQVSTLYIRQLDNYKTALKC